MYFRISADTCELVDPEDVRSFAVRSKLTGADLVAAVRRAELGEVLPDGEHIMVEVAAIHRLAGDRVTAGWTDDLAAMLAYADRKGWLSADGSAVRAHVEQA